MKKCEALVWRTAGGDGLERVHDLVVAAEQLVDREVRSEHAPLDAERCNRLLHIGPDAIDGPGPVAHSEA